MTVLLILLAAIVSLSFIAAVLVCGTHHPTSGTGPREFRPPRRRSFRFGPP